MLKEYLCYYLKNKYKTNQIYFLQHPKYNPDCTVVIINNMILGFYYDDMVKIVKKLRGLGGVCEI